jgi:hypothetical protein
VSIDLDELEAKCKAMTPVPWKSRPDSSWASNEYRIDSAEVYSIISVDSRLARDNGANASGIVSLVNAAPELIRLARIGQAAEAEKASQAHRDEQRCKTCGHPRSNHPRRHIFVGSEP